jgi:hypothetical protein
LRAARLDYDGSLPTAGFSPNAILGFGPEGASSKDLSWMGDYSDELAVAIALRMFEEAVVLVEKGSFFFSSFALEDLALRISMNNQT